MVLLGNGKGIFDFRIEGEVIHVDEPDEFYGKTKNKIIVAKSPSPSMYILLKECSGIITENGGVTSHLAIVGCELNKPVIVGIQSIYSKVADGDIVRIESTDGIGAVYAIR